MSARDKVIGAIRAGLGARGDEPGRRGQVRARLERSPHGLIPARARQTKPELIAQFARMLEAQTAVVRTVENLKALPQAIAEQLAAFNLPARLRHGDDPVIAGLDWEGTMIERETGPAIGTDAISLSRASLAASETGTLILTSGADNPSTLNFLPDTHFVVLLAENLHGSYEEAWDALRTTYGRGAMPRTVNFVSGPSATADIEHTLVRGAHGPRRLAVFVVLNGQPTRRKN
ncbi:MULTISPECIES: lactate utilization protein [Rhodomicrobium]|uniref:LutC/YkgG family protein n=1 Tax=Rhodomicrobium TaxID=1068 RepID=UPI000B4B6F52|nr:MULTISPECIES: lactate utilization protein [Rhodomicrobium]